MAILGPGKYIEEILHGTKKRKVAKLKMSTFANRYTQLQFQRWQCTAFLSL